MNYKPLLAGLLLMLGACTAPAQKAVTCAVPQDIHVVCTQMTGVDKTTKLLCIDRQGNIFDTTQPRGTS